MWLELRVWSGMYLINIHAALLQRHEDARYWIHGSSEVEWTKHDIGFKKLPDTVRLHTHSFPLPFHCQSP